MVELGAGVSLFLHEAINSIALKRITKTMRPKEIISMGMCILQYLRGFQMYQYVVLYLFFIIYSESYSTAIQGRLLK